jgi:hypothetical protein
MHEAQHRTLPSAEVYSAQACRRGAGGSENKTSVSACAHRYLCVRDCLCVYTWVECM